MDAPIMDRRSLDEFCRSAQGDAGLRGCVNAVALLEPDDYQSVRAQLGMDATDRLMRALLDRLHLTERLRHPGATYDALRAEKPDLPDYPADVKEQLEIDIRYEGYIDRQRADRQRFLKMEDTPLPPDADYLNMSGLRIEARQKLDAQRPRSLGQASRIPGINPGDVTVLMIWLRARG